MFSDSGSDQLFIDEPDPGNLFFEATLNVSAATFLLTENPLPSIDSTLAEYIDPMLAEYAGALVEGISALASSSALAQLFHNKDVELHQFDTLHSLRNVLRRFHSYTYSRHWQSTSGA